MQMEQVEQERSTTQVANVMRTVKIQVWRETWIKRLLESGAQGPKAAALS